MLLKSSNWVTLTSHWAQSPSSSPRPQMAWLLISLSLIPRAHQDLQSCRGWVPSGKLEKAARLLVSSAGAAR